MLKFAYISAAILALGGSMASATIVNIASTSATGSTLALTAGHYSVSFIGKADGGAYDAYTQFTPPVGGYTDANSLCQSGSSECRYGYQNNFVVDTGTSSKEFKLAATPPLPGYFRFSTEAAALAAAKAGPYTSPFEFTLAGPANVKFYIADIASQYGDNSGGTSINVAAVPEPATWAMFVVGFGLVGAATRRRAPRSTLAA